MMTAQLVKKQSKSQFDVVMALIKELTGADEAKRKLVQANFLREFREGDEKFGEIVRKRLHQLNTVLMMFENVRKHIGAARAKLLETKQHLEEIRPAVKRKRDIVQHLLCTNRKIELELEEIFFHSVSTLNEPEVTKINGHVHDGENKTVKLKVEQEVKLTKSEETRLCEADLSPYFVKNFSRLKPRQPLFQFKR